MTPNKKTASAVGAKTARACDSCIQKRARWYCAADDVFLCQSCDSTVHSANLLARRHERVRLKTASLRIHIDKKASAKSSAPSWHRGFTKRARTPRHGKQTSHRHQSSSKSKDTVQYPLPLVPELGADECTSQDENEEQLLYRVPIYDPFLAEFCISTPSNEASPSTNLLDVTFETVKREQTKATKSPHDEYGDVGDLNCFLPSEMDLAEFAADVESLLGKGLDQETYTMEELGLLNDEEDDSTIFERSMSSGYSKVKDEGEGNTKTIMSTCHMETETDIIREPFELTFDYDSPTTCEEEDVKAIGQHFSAREQGNEAGLHQDHEKKGKISLRLDYEAIRAAWDGQRSPWMNGERPEINPDDCWPHGMGTYGTEVHPSYGGTGVIGGGEQAALGDGGREARVSRYREKRRTRLFSKKIRYEVRKLNAEKRPRMKGRFVKRSSFAPTSFPILGK